MELRQLHTNEERTVFATKLAAARSTRGFGFRETAYSEVGNVHIRFGSLYALFESESDPTEKMVGGFILHHLAALPQSFPKPDLTHVPPSQVIEAGELWSLSKGLAKLAAGATAAICSLRQARAILVYPILRPLNLALPYSQFGFVNGSDPVKWPYAEANDGGDVWVQPMVLEGAALDRYLAMGEALFSSKAPTGLRFADELRKAPCSPSSRPEPWAKSDVSNHQIPDAVA
jgi:hypothetical protein